MVGRNIDEEFRNKHIHVLDNIGDKTQENIYNMP